MSKKTISFLCLKGLQQFIDPIANELESEYNITKCYSNLPVNISNAIDEADIVWFEWANELLLDISTNKNAFNFEGKQVICRVHSYEVLSGFIEKIDWTIITDVIFVADHVRELAIKTIVAKNPGIREHKVTNGVDLRKFTLDPRKMPGRNICFCGYINHKKSPDLMLQAFNSLRNFKRPEFFLNVAGQFQDMRYVYYMEHISKELGLSKKSKFHSWVEDMNTFYQNMNYVLVSSPWESQHMACMEAMACGVYPLIHNFVGAKLIYPDEYIWSYVEDIPEIVKKSEQNFNPKKLRSFIEENYSFEITNAGLKKIFDLGMELKQVMPVQNRNLPKAPGKKGNGWRK